MCSSKIPNIAIIILVMALVLSACKEDKKAEDKPREKLKVGLVIDSGTELDRSFNQYSLEGAQRASEENGLEFSFLTSQSVEDYESHVESLIQDGADMVVTVGFRMGDATSKSAQRHPNVKFAIVDNAYFPGAGCPENATDCYSQEGGLANVTSLMFAEDEVAYLAGTLAACVSEADIIAVVAGIEIPPVVRFVTGFERGAKSFNPEVTALHQYVPDFNDPATGKVVAQDFISQGADVIFGAGGNTGNGGLLAAHEAGLMAIGVDVDQYFTYEEVKTSLLSSAAKNMDVAVETAVNDFAQGKLEGGVRTFTLANGGVGLAPYHDWEEKIPQECKTAVEKAKEAVIADPTITGAK